MSLPVSRMWIAFALACVAAAAHADIYTWIDKKGVTNVSNLTPPDDAKVTNVLRSQPRDAAREAAVREAARQAEVRALSEKVQQLQSEVDQARREPPRALAYAPPPPLYASPATINVVNVMQPPAPSAPAYNGCDYAFGDCGYAFWPGFGYYGAGFAGGRGKNFRHAGAGNPGNGQIVPPLIPLPPHFGGGGGGHPRPGPG